MAHWTDDIAEITTDAEFQNASIRVYDPSLLTADFDLTGGGWTVSGDGDVISTRARIISTRWGVNRENADTANGSTVTSLRVQMPKNIVGRLKKGMKMVVESCDDNPSLTSFLYNLTSDLQGSNAASRTFEFAVDGDYVGA